ncbi:MAG: DUF2284 domain-containing protein [Spirochaetaceae bacterium]|jgi:predicted metal-binding protein|nr:DUF2284 domain-containing protein [Spirochaetaceae bacterium]
MKELVEKVLQGRAHEWSVVPTQEISFSPELRKACEVNTCGNYNKSWSCPPAVGTVEEQREKILVFEKAFVFTTKFDLEDSFDYEGMIKAKDIHNELTMEIHRQFGKTNPVYGAGGCVVCEKCAFPEPCRFPDRMISSVEAAGINVAKLSQKANIKYHNGPNTVTYFSMILFNEQP